MAPIPPVAIEDSRPSRSLAEECAAKKEEALETATKGLSKKAKHRLLYSWEFWGRRNQLLQTLIPWFVWLCRCGRGWGKSRTGAEAVRAAVEKHGCRRIALVARTASDARDVMVEGESGLLAICPPWNRPKYERSKRRLTWPNGAIATLYSADNPDLLRGPQHDFAWCDELAAWRYVEKSWDNLVMGLRLKSGLCRIIVTTTPRRIPFLRELCKDPSTLLTLGSTYQNLKNLKDEFRRNLLRYKGSSKEREELFGDMIGDVDGALWAEATIHKHRITDPSKLPKRFRKIVCGVDPSLSDNKDSDECGIVVAGLGFDGHTYVLGDYSKKLAPDKWAQAVVRACLRHKVNCIAVETNAGKKLIELTIRNAFKLAKKHLQCPRIIELHSDESKSDRADPVVVLYNIGMVHHLGKLVDLEDEQTSWVPAQSKKSPNRIDALVFAVNELNPMTGGPVRAASANKAHDYKAATMPQRS